MTSQTSAHPFLLSDRFQDQPLSVTRGSPLPLGASPTHDGINFVLISRHATAVHLVIFEGGDEATAAEIPLDPRMFRTGDHWHVRV
ncbi:MAG: hypothetical protein JO284_03610, partial [Planctomycetaceae bacterium]|nr:hypothetical protein [Planctomycetaceae bacterium]